MRKFLHPLLVKMLKVATLDQDTNTLRQHGHLDCGGLLELSDEIEGLENKRSTRHRLHKGKKEERLLIVFLFFNKQKQKEGKEQKRKMAKKKRELKRYAGPSYMGL